MKKGIKYIFLVIVSILIFIYIYEFPCHRFMAERKYKSYMKQNVIEYEDISDIYYQKDYKQGGYYVIVEYKNKPGHRYEYQYHIFIDKKEGLRFDYMRCFVYNSNNHIIDWYEL